MPRKKHLSKLFKGRRCRIVPVESAVEINNDDDVEPSDTKISIEPIGSHFEQVRYEGPTKEISSSSEGQQEASSSTITTLSANSRNSGVTVTSSVLSLMMMYMPKNVIEGTQPDKPDKADKPTTFNSVPVGRPTKLPPITKQIHNPIADGRPRTLPPIFNQPHKKEADVRPAKLPPIFNQPNQTVADGRPTMLPSIYMQPNKTVADGRPIKLPPISGGPTKLPPINKLNLFPERLISTSSGLTDVESIGRYSDASSSAVPASPPKTANRSRWRKWKKRILCCFK